MKPEVARVLQSFEAGTDGFMSVLDRLNGTDRSDDFERYE